jgi:hypothetical protein
MWDESKLHSQSVSTLAVTSLAMPCHSDPTNRTLCYLTRPGICHITRYLSNYQQSLTRDLLPCLRPRKSPKEQVRAALY